MMNCKNKTKLPMKVMKRHFHGGWYEQFCFGIAMRRCGGSVFSNLYRADDSDILSSGRRLGVVHGSTDGHGNVLVCRSPGPAGSRRLSGDRSDRSAKPNCLPRGNGLDDRRTIAVDVGVRHTHDYVACDSSLPRSRGPEVILGPEWAGSMTHDGWLPYDFFEKAWHQQCLAHLLSRAKTLVETASRWAVHFPRKVKALLQNALALRDRSRCIGTGSISPHGRSPSGIGLEDAGRGCLRRFGFECVSGIGRARTGVSLDSTDQGERQRPPGQTHRTR